MARPLRAEDAHEYVQHINWVTKGRIPYFLDPKCALPCLEAIERERARLKVDVFAYTLMPDHFHMVIGPAPFRLGEIVQGMKLASAFVLRYQALIPGSPWARDYWDRAIRSDRQFRVAINYVHWNPIEAGLVADPLDYPYSSFRFHECGETGIVKVVSPSIS